MFTRFYQPLQAMRPGLARMAKHQALHSPQNNETLELAVPAILEGFGWRRHAECLAHALQREHIGQTAGLQHIANFGITVRYVLGGIVRMNFRTRPDRKDLTGKPVQGPNKSTQKYR